VEATAHRHTYRVVGPLITPDARNPIVRSVWIVLHGDDVPRFVTAVANKMSGGDHDGESFTVEFFRDGDTVAIADVTAAQIRRIERAG